MTKRKKSPRVVHTDLLKKSLRLCPRVDPPRGASLLSDVSDCLRQTQRTTSFRLCSVTVSGVRTLTSVLYLPILVLDFKFLHTFLMEEEIPCVKTALLSPLTTSRVRLQLQAHPRGRDEATKPARLADMPYGGSSMYNLA